MTFPLDYSWYSAKPLAEQVDWFDELDWGSIAQPQEQRSIKKFFQAVYENDASAYTRQKAVEWFSELALGNVLRPSAARDFLLDVTDPESYIQVTKLKYLFLLFGDEPEVNHELEVAFHSEDVDVASEAYYRKGLLHLLYRAGQASEVDFFEELTQARYFFDQAMDTLASRIDAQFFGLVAQCLKELFAAQPTAYNNTFKELASILWQRELWGKRQVSELFEWHVYHSLSNIKALAEHSSRQEKDWLDYRREFTLLSKYANDAVAIHSLSHQLQRSYQQFTSTIVANLLDEYYINNISACALKIDTHIAEIGDTDSALTSFLVSLKERIKAKEQKKSPNTNLSLLAQFVQAFPAISSEQMIYDLHQYTDTGISEEKALLRLSLQYTNQFYNSNRVVAKTGVDITDKIINRIGATLHRKLPNYPANELAVFLDVLTDIAIYSFNADTGSKANYALHYDSTAKAESVFQNDLYDRLRITQRAQNYRLEASHVVSGGRIDILYQEGNILFPIEVKRESKLSTWEEVERNYVPQAQTYATPYNQLGFLVIFDISLKKKQGPLPDFKERFAVLHHKPLYPLAAKHPNYIIAVIIPANRITPSDLTRYSS